MTYLARGRTFATLAATLLTSSVAMEAHAVDAAPPSQTESEPAPPAPVREFPMRGGVYAGTYYGFGLGDRVDYDSAQYLQIGGFFDHRWFHVSVESPMPFVIVDGIAALIGLAAGKDIGLPVFGALNGEQDPGRFRLFDVQAAVRVLRAGPHALEVGARGDFNMIQAYLDGERNGSSLFDLGATAGYAFSTDHVLLRTNVTGGNGFGSERAANPFVGASAFAHVRVYGQFGLTARFDGLVQRMDLRSEDTEEITTSTWPVDVVEWAAFGITTFGLTVILE